MSRLRKPQDRRHYIVDRKKKWAPHKINVLPLEMQQIEKNEHLKFRLACLLHEFGKKHNTSTVLATLEKIVELEKHDLLADLLLMYVSWDCCVSKTNYKTLLKKLKKFEDHTDGTQKN